MKKKKIDPAKATPQAPRSLRVGSKGEARALAAKAEGKPAPAAAEDDDEDADPDDEDEDEHDQEAHDAACQAAADKMRAGAEAYDAAKGTDSASALQAAEDAGDEAVEAHGAGKASCMKLRGAAPEEDEATPAPRPPAAAAAQALGALAGPNATAQIELAQLAGFARETMVALGTKTIAGAAAKRDLAIRALAEAPKRKAAEALATCIARLDAACFAGMPRAKAFTIKSDGALGAPLATWANMSPEALDEVLSLYYGPAGEAPPGGTRPIIVPSAEATAEAGIEARAATNGVPVDIQRAAEANRSKDR